MKFLLLLLSFLISPPLLAAPNPGDFYTSGPRHAKRIALTFDDGPGPYTERFLDLFEREKIKVTFFVLGELVQYKPAVVKMIVEKGHELGTHTFNHVNYKARYKTILTEMTAKGLGEKEATAAAETELLNDMKKAHALILKASGLDVTLCRMPNGIDRPWIKEVAKKQGYALINWTYGADWNAQPVEKLLPGYLKAIEPGAIFLFHDGGRDRSKSLALTEAVIKSAKEQGYEIVPVGTLLSSN